MAELKHGTRRGYMRGCKCPECTRANTRTCKQYLLKRARGVQLTRPRIGVQRRILALGAMGYSRGEIAQAAGLKHRTNLQSILESNTNDWVICRVADPIHAAYERLSVAQPARPSARVIRAALELGGLPPEMWDDADLDNPDAVPLPVKALVGYVVYGVEEVDVVAVDRAMRGHPESASPADLREACRRLVALGMTDEEVGRRLRRTDRTIFRWRLRMGLESQWAA